MLVAAAAMLALGAAACVPPAPPPPTVIVYGDSLTQQSQSYLVKQLNAQAPGWRVIVRALGGTAICDWLPHMNQDGDEGAEVVVVQFSGNSLTACMGGRAVGSQPWFDKYHADARTAAGIWHTRGVDVLFVGNPAGVCDSPPHPLDATYQSVATEFGMTFSDAPERALTVTLEPAATPPDPSDPTTLSPPDPEDVHVAGPPQYAAGEAPEEPVQAQSTWPCTTPVTATDVFAYEMPCLPTETAAQGCETVSSGEESPSTIAVRDGSPAAPGGHFPCPGHPSGASAPCTGYSSGIARFAGAIVTETVKLLSA